MKAIGGEGRPIQVLLVEDRPGDVQHANCYLRKPVQLDEFEALVKSINDFWLTKVMLPQQRQSG
jgi:hypothetical protein